MTGQCKCLDGVIGRTCTACTPGFFGESWCGCCVVLCVVCVCVCVCARASVHARMEVSADDLLDLVRVTS